MREHNNKNRRVVSNNPEGSSGMILTIQGPLEFQPGQHIAVSTLDGPKPRLYSILNSDDQGNFRILYTLVADGALTPKLISCQPGDFVTVGSPMGSFFDGHGRVLWIAAGTGIAPFVSMAAHGINPGQERVLLHSARREDELYCREYFTNKPRIEYLPFSTRDKPGDGIIFGRITPWLMSIAKDDLMDFRSILICGSTQMIMDLREVLISRGVEYSRIFSEIYF